MSRPVSRPVSRSVGRAVDRPDRGSVTLPAIACLGVLLLLGSALGVAAAMVTAHRRAQGAADLAALAAAVAAGRGGPPCAAAEDIAGRNGARLSACEVAGRVVEVEVRVAGPRWLGAGADLTGRARAGPGSGPAAVTDAGRGLPRRGAPRGAPPRDGPAAPTARRASCCPAGA